MRCKTRVEAQGTHGGAAHATTRPPAASRLTSYYGRLRYVVRLDGVNVNLRLVAVAAAAPWFYEGRRGMYANRLEALAKRARAKKLGLWEACPRTVYNPYAAIETRR